MADDKKPTNQNPSTKPSEAQVTFDHSIQLKKTVTPTSSKPEEKKPEPKK